MASEQEKKQELDNAKFVAFLENIVNPVQEAKIELEVKGLYNIPEDIQTIEKTNANFFMYKIQFEGIDITNGKILPRLQTHKEIFESAEAENKKKKNKSEDDMEQLKQNMLREEEEEKNLQEELQHLDETQKLYKLSEHKYKFPYMSWEDKRLQSTTKQSDDMQKFEEKITEQGGVYLKFIRVPDISEEELVKQKKSKPKNMQLTDLNPLMAQAWVDLRELQVPGTTQIIQRCKLEQIVGEDPANEATKVNFEKSYVYIVINLDQPIFKVVDEESQKPINLIKQVVDMPKFEKTSDIINEFRNDLVQVIDNLSFEYNQMHGKEIPTANNNRVQDKNFQTVTIQKKDQILRRQGEFIFDFLRKGKYNLIKERIKKSIIKICRDKFQKQGLPVGSTTEQRDQFFSEINVFLKQQAQQILHSVVMNKKNELHEDIVISYDETLKDREKLKNTLNSKTKQQNFSSLAKEYEILQYMDFTEKNYLNLIAVDESNGESWYEYAKFCIRNKNFAQAEEALQKSISLGKQGRDQFLLMVIILIRRQRYLEAKQILLDILESGNKADMLVNVLLQFLFGNYCLKEHKSYQKYNLISERIYMKNNGTLPPQSNNKQNINPFELPNIRQIIQQQQEDRKNGPALIQDQIDEIQRVMIDYFAAENVPELIEKALPLLHDQSTETVQFYQSQILMFKEKYSEAIQIYSQILQKNPKNFNAIIQKAKACFLADKFYEYEETFYTAMKTKQQTKEKFSVYLRLGYIYLKRKSWQDAKQIFIKTCEQKPESPLSWFGLGIANLRQKMFKQAEEGLTQANIYDPQNPEVWGFIALLCLLAGNRLEQALQSIKLMFKFEIENFELLEELGDEFVKIQKYELAEACYKQIIQIWETKKQSNSINYGKINQKLGQIYSDQAKLELAKYYFEKALQMLEGKNEKAYVQSLIDKISHSGADDLYLESEEQSLNMNEN